ncbi:MAG: sugar phosphate isomerase/epimerase [Acidimicrobiia bacterium]|nr:sugar phosphate isomerase/epimerase [Acidimicrobiia bacterium]MYD42215.1 sugar phosphate isomerase/epimerase [Acidimicrobiia bacterium]MYG93239.1 sugar phosphate isomerase/epimerase [Acidimicrobiia bacterium]
MTRPVGIEIFYWLDSWYDDQSAVFHKAAEAGYDGVEMSFVAGTDVGVRDIAGAAASLGLDVLCSTGLTPTMDVSSPDEGIRSSGVYHLKWCLDQAADLGSPILGGVTYAPWMGFPEGDLQGHRQRSAESLHTVAEYAAEVGVDLCLEVLNRFETYMFNTVSDCLSFIEMVGHDSVKVELDTFHMNMEEEDLAGAVRQAAGRIGHVQVAANNRRAPQYGHIDWRSFKEALDDVDYGGYVVFETFPNSAVQTGRDTYAWRDLYEDLDAEAAGAAAFIRKHLS